MRLTVVLVHYRTPDLVPAAWKALREDAASAGLELEAVLVDNGSEARDRAALELEGLRRLDPGENLGYAAAVNLAMAETTSELALLANPDVRVRPGCLAALVGELERDAAVVAPEQTWDEGGHWKLPPAERRTRVDELAGALAGRRPAVARWARLRWRRHARRFWGARRPISSVDLSGALLVLRREAWERVGPFDEAYRLYFEETDWLHRVRRAGLPTRYVPWARVHHLHAASTRHEPRSARWFEESARRFRDRRYGPLFRRILERVAAPVPPAEPTPELARLRVDDLPPEAAWAELSPRSIGFPAAGRRLDARTGLLVPDDLAVRLDDLPLRLSLLDERGREI